MDRRSAAFALLGLPPDAERATIHRVFRERIKQCHPDRGPGADPDRAAALIAAYAELTDRRVDQHGDEEISDLAGAILRHRARRGSRNWRRPPKRRPVLHWRWAAVIMILAALAWPEAVAGWP